MTPSTGIYGSGISVPKAVILSTPVLGFLAGFVILRHLWCSCCYSSPVIDRVPAAETAINNPLVRQAVVAGVNPQSYSQSFGSNMGAAIPDLKKEMLKEKVHLICGMVSALLTLAGVVVLIAMGYFEGYLAQTMAYIPLAALLTYSLGYYVNYKNLSRFDSVTSQK